jgi:hypothetical protein
MQNKQRFRRKKTKTWKFSVTTKKKIEKKRPVLLKKRDLKKKKKWKFKD